MSARSTWTTWKSLVQHKRRSGISLTTLGFGSGNYNYALMEQLADVGNGNAAYIDSSRRRESAGQRMQSTLGHRFGCENTSGIQPALVGEYRLIGYENRLLRRELIYQRCSRCR